jgi:beta-glucanase (GH16 family)
MRIHHVFATLLLPCTALSQVNAYKPATSIKTIPGYTLAWHDEFNVDGKPDSTNWNYEQGFVRNEELQWYQPANARCTGGVLLIEGRRQRVANPHYQPGSSNWRSARQYAEYTSACITTGRLRQFGYGRFEVRARIDTAMGAWPAIWTLGTSREWPGNGEVDIMEFYRVNNVPTILANVAWATQQRNVAKWNTQRTPLVHFTGKDPDWVNKFHVWRMDWNKDSIALYLDDELLNVTLLNRTINADGSNPFKDKPMFILLNLALGQNGGSPADTKFPVKYEVDYVRYWKKD